MAAEERSFDARGDNDNPSLKQMAEPSADTTQPPVSASPDEEALGRSRIEVHVGPRSFPRSFDWFASSDALDHPPTFRRSVTPPATPIANPTREAVDTPHTQSLLGSLPFSRSSSFPLYSSFPGSSFLLGSPSFFGLIARASESSRPTSVDEQFSSFDVPNEFGGSLPSPKSVFIPRSGFFPGSRSFLQSRSSPGSQVFLGPISRSRSFPGSRFFPRPPSFPETSPSPRHVCFLDMIVRASKHRQPIDLYQGWQWFPPPGPASFTVSSSSDSEASLFPPSFRFSNSPALLGSRSFYGSPSSPGSSAASRSPSFLDMVALGSNLRQQTGLKKHTQRFSPLLVHTSGDLLRAATYGRGDFDEGSFRTNYAESPLEKNILSGLLKPGLSGLSLSDYLSESSGLGSRGLHGSGMFVSRSVSGTSPKIYDVSVHSLSPTLELVVDDPGSVKSVSDSGSKVPLGHGSGTSETGGSDSRLSSGLFGPMGHKSVDDDPGLLKPVVRGPGLMEQSNEDSRWLKLDGDGSGLLAPSLFKSNPDRDSDTQDLFPSALLTVAAPASALWAFPLAKARDLLMQQRSGGFLQRGDRELEARPRLTHLADRVPDLSLPHPDLPPSVVLQGNSSYPPQHQGLPAATLPQPQIPSHPSRVSGEPFSELGGGQEASPVPSEDGSGDRSRPGLAQIRSLLDILTGGDSSHPHLSPDVTTDVDSSDDLPDPPTASLA